MGMVAMSEAIWATLEATYIHNVIKLSAQAECKKETKGSREFQRPSKETMRPAEKVGKK
jgi:hypothetical protein